MEQAGGGSGDTLSNVRQPAPGNSGPWFGAAPALPARNRHSGGVGAPPGGTMASCQELADVAGLGPGGLMRTLCRQSSNRRRVQRNTPPSTKARPDAVVRTPQQSVERRAGLRHWPVISERSRRSTRPRGGSRGAALPHQRLSALCSPHFFWGAEKRRRAPGAPPTRAAQRWLKRECGAEIVHGASGKLGEPSPPLAGESWRGDDEKRHA